MIPATLGIHATTPAAKPIPVRPANRSAKFRNARPINPSVLTAARFTVNAVQIEFEIAYASRR